MSDHINAKVIADLKRELAEARAEIEQQRTRAEAAEQELRAEKERGNSAWDDGYAKSSSRAKVAEAKLAAIRAHLAGVDVVEIAGAWRIRRMAMRLAESSLDREAIAGQAKAIQLAECALFDAAEKLLAAAREALDP